MAAEENPVEVEWSGATLAAELRPSLVSFFRRRCGNSAEAEDLAHDVIVRALNHDHWASAEHGRAYLFRIAENCWRDRGRRSLVRSAWTEDHTAVREDSSPERLVISEDELDRVLDALDELGERTRDIFLLCRFEGVRKADAAAAMGISVSAVDKHLARAMAWLAKSLE